MIVTHYLVFWKEIYFAKLCVSLRLSKIVIFMKLKKIELLIIHIYNEMMER